MSKRGRKKKVESSELVTSFNFDPTAASSPSVRGVVKLTKQTVEKAFRKKKLAEINQYFDDLQEKVLTNFATIQFQVAPRWDFIYESFTDKENFSGSSFPSDNVTNATEIQSSTKKLFSSGSRRSRRSKSESRETRPSPIGESTEYDGEFKRPTIGFSSSKKKLRRSSSTSRIGSSDMMKTPASKLVAPVALVTPLNRSKGPINIYRRPQAGEVVVSLNGSPLLVSTDNVRRPQLTVPVNSGEKVLSILPALSSGYTGAIPRVLEENLKEDLRSLKEMICKMID